MTRKAGRVPEETRARLLEAATEEFCQVGFQKTSLRTICAHAGVTTGAVYFFFEGKDDLLVHIIDPVCKEFLEFIDKHYGAHAKENHAGLYATKDEDIAMAHELIEIIKAHRPAVTVLLQNQEHEAVVAFLDKAVDQLIAYLIGLEETISRYYPNARGAGGETTTVWLAHVITDSFLEAVSASFRSKSYYSELDADDQEKDLLDLMPDMIIGELRISIQMVLRYRMFNSGQTDVPKEVLPLPAD
ncbi:MAG: TetR/AcrR family transcriptional regulator [Eggerthellaceae bacterium]|jgi:AcrR family transcriptional regulator